MVSSGTPASDNSVAKDLLRLWKLRPGILSTFAARKYLSQRLVNVQCLLFIGLAGPFTVRNISS
jgi:hypothetical protein